MVSIGPVKGRQLALLPLRRPSPHKDVGRASASLERLPSGPYDGAITTDGHGASKKVSFRRVKGGEFGLLAPRCRPG